jgi:hypothetical protein
VCEWHRIREAQGLTSPAPVVLVPRTKPLQPSPKVRRSNKAGYSAEAIEKLRRYEQGDAE